MRTMKPLTPVAFEHVVETLLAKIRKHVFRVRMTYAWNWIGLGKICHNSLVQRQRR